MRYIFVLALLLPYFVSSQILNAESLRKVTDTSGWSGNASFNFALKRSVNDFFTLGSDMHIQYKMKRNLILIKNDVAFQKIDGENFDNSFISHLRYNYKLSDFITWEAFTQGQFNKVNLIKFRGLMGTGPRFKLSKSEKYKFYLGTLPMYEYEEVDDGITPLQRNFRASCYLSFSLYPTDHISFISTSYYQPRFDQLDDYRISSESTLAVGLFQNFSLNTTYTFIFDAFPAVGIPESQYNLTTGIAYSFD